MRLRNRIAILYRAFIEEVQQLLAFAGRFLNGLVIMATIGSCFKANDSLLLI